MGNHGFPRSQHRELRLRGGHPRPPRSRGPTPDAASRRAALPLDGQTRELAGPFDVGGYATDYPGDANVPPAESARCGCTCEASYGAGASLTVGSRGWSCSATAAASPTFSTTQ
jgi:hypothetical protein